MNKEICHRTTTGSLEGSMLFPEVVQLLSEIGLESYTVDLVRMKKIFYMPDGETHEESLDFPKAVIGNEFQQSEVQNSIRASQKKEVSYREFLSRVMTAGTTTYTVYIAGRRAVYSGRKGDFHVEHFPT